jgi:hypothetical protein
VTNILFTRCEPIPRPPMLVTNLFVTRYEEWVPPLLVTNAVVVTNQNYVPVPGQTWLHVVAVSGDRLVRTGTATVRNELAGYDTYEAHWTGEGTLLWLPNASGQAWGGPFFLGDAVGLRFAPGILPWFGGGSRLLAFDVSATAAPALLSAVDLASGDFTGFNVTGVALSGSRAYASVSRSEWVPAAYQPTPENVVTRAWWDWNGSWRTSHELRVVDFTDPSEPVVRAAVPLPGELLGVSHAGNLLYARTNAFTTNGTSAGALAALAYDGVAASLVAARRLPDGSEPLLVRADGRILVGRRDASRVEIWALTDAAELETFDVLEMPTLVNRFLGFGGLVVADGDGAVAAIDLSGARVVVSGTGDRPCGLWFDPAAADATRESGLWIPRGDAGLWRISFGTP